MPVCSFTLNGECCIIPDPKHAIHHDAGNGVRFSDRDSDQGQKAA